MSNSTSRAQRQPLRWLCAVGLIAMAGVGCVQLQQLYAPPAPEVSSQWQALIDDLRAFEKRIGFRETRNFASLSAERESFAYCGQASSRHLPYSYEDPAIRWLEQITAEQCRDVESDTDAYFGSVEVWGEIGTPVTASMIDSKLDRFVYLVIHEDCHDQFELPYGIEEALCNIIAYRAMASFSAEKFRWYTRENRAIRNYTRVQARQTRATIGHYAELEALYGRYHRSEISLDALRTERARVFARSEQALELESGEMNNIVMASYMTYSRHYPYLEASVDRLGSDLRSTLDFFRVVDQRKPSKEAVMKRHRLVNQKSVDFVRAYEAAVIDTIAQTLKERP